MAARSLAATLEQFANGELPLVEFANAVFGGERHLVSHVQRVHSEQINIDSPEVSRCVQAVLKVLAEAVHVNPDGQAVIRWFNQERLADFEGRTPAEVVADGKTDALVQYIRSLDAGWTG